MTDEKQTELLQLTARLAIQCCLDNSFNINGMSANLCNLHELALASLGYEDTHPQVPLNEIILYVRNQLDGKFLPTLSLNES